MTSSEEREPLLRLTDDNGAETLRVEQDGTASFAPNADLNDVSRRFWQAVAGQQGVTRFLRPKLAVFVSGPNMEHEWRAFRSAATMLGQAGYQVLDPTTIESWKPENTYETNVRITLSALLLCNAVALLPNWHRSNACLREVEVANACGMTVAPLDYWLVDDGQ